MVQTGFGYEIDFLPVGNGEKSGDAIIVRYGSVEDYKIMVIDGGTKASGKAVVEHIKKYYGTDHVDYVVNTHPDGDHASGLSVVLEELSVGELWIHRPWEYSSEIKDMFKDGRITDNSLSERLKESLKAAYRLEELALENNVPVKEPFQGEKIGLFTVMSPSREWYKELVPKFSKSPDAKESVVGEFMDIFKSIRSAGQAVLESIINLVDESWDIETLSEGSETSAENNSSVTLYGYLKGNGILFTGDAGIDSLNKTVDYAESIGVDLKQVKFIQVPHHGSRNNVSPSVLDTLVGCKVSKDAEPTKTGFVSASKESTKHPRKVVLNAFKRRGVKVFKQNGQTIWHRSDMPDRDGWVTLIPIEFYDQVEEKS